MFDSFSQQGYDELLAEIFQRFPSVQNVPFFQAYKPGLERMLEFDEILGSPDSSYKIIHVAGTNGKGSVSNMLASAISAHGHKTGLFTSPHIEDFRERMRISGPSLPIATMVPKEYAYSFLMRYKADFERLSLSFFEITTGMAMKWFADEGVDYAVFEVGLGGRLDSTNIVSPTVTAITSIGLDHCDLLGHTLSEIAGEKAGIIKTGVPVVIGENNPQTRLVFESRACEKGSMAVFAEDSKPPLWKDVGKIHAQMDLRGEYQLKNLRTAMWVLDLLGMSDEKSSEALIHTAQRMDFHGRWEKLSDKPLVLCDIGHNAHALQNNFRQLDEMMASGKFDALHIVYGVMSDKDFDSIMPLMPENASYYFAAPLTKRALPADRILQAYSAWLFSEGKKMPQLYSFESVAAAVQSACSHAGSSSLIYIGGSNFVVAEALPLFCKAE